MIPGYLLYYYFGLLYMMLPAYFANMAPVFVRKLPWDTPMDFGKKWRGERILGSHKTWRGLVAAVLVGELVFLLQDWIYPLPFFTKLSLVNYTSISAWLGVSLGLGAILGDAVKSFFKRRVHVKPGRPWIPFDQIDYTLGAILFTWPWIRFTFKEALFIVTVSALLHMGVNYLGYLLGINKAKL